MCVCVELASGRRVTKNGLVFTAHATVTEAMRGRKLDMAGCSIISVSPNKPNVCYEVVHKSTVDEDFDSTVQDLAAHYIRARCIFVYCQSLGNLLTRLLTYIHAFYKCR